MANGSNSKGLGKKNAKRKFADTPKYADLAERLETVGQKLRTRSFDRTRTLTLAPPKTYKSKKINKIIEKAEYKNIQLFGTDYRNAWKNQDELVSTSTIRSIMTGMDISTMSTKDKEKLTETFDEISRIRFETKYSGFNLSDDWRMQHPTAKNQGLYANSGETGSIHNALDRERQAVVADAMEKELENDTASVQDVLYAGARAAIGYTLNMFDAPPTAKNVTVVKKGEDLQAITQKRESLKDVYRQLNGKVRAGKNTSTSRNWIDPRKQTARSLRSVSPPRIPEKSKTLC